MTPHLTNARNTDPLSSLARAGRITDEELRALSSWLLGQLSAWEHAKLGQGGHANTEVPLRRVFVDLPVSSQTGSDEDGDARVPFLARLLRSRPVSVRRAQLALEKGAIKGGLIKSVGYHTELRQTTNQAKAQQNYALNLLIGGPGQGKSTLGQLACQLHRAALLRPLEHNFTTTGRELIRSFVPDTEGERGWAKGLSLPNIKLIPLQISLPDLSAWLSHRKSVGGSEEVPSILLFLASLSSARESGVTAELLCKIITKLPVLIVLDGFDEVGAGDDRNRLILAANELLHFLAFYEGYAQIIATTRPQGYMGEFDRISVKLQSHFLMPLGKDEALEYAGKLVYAKIANPDEREQTLDRLREASRESSTERLMTTPLQVTILAALVHQRGRAPKERWNLFFGYFTYVYARETERNSYASGLLRDYRPLIEQIHARVGLLLQVESERAFGAPKMPRLRLEEVIHAVLDEAGYADEDRDVLAKNIAVAAELRLVFLVEPEPGNFGFEIRSFQEFMSAWALTSGSDAQVEERLKEIARAPMFRNVMLFVSSKLFSEGSHLRDALTQRILPSLDDRLSDAASFATKAGALLALETLEEGAALSFPKWSKLLMSNASRLLELPPSNEHRRLAKAGNEDTRKFLRDIIERADVDGHYMDPLAVWITLLEGTNRREDWAISLANARWSVAQNHEEILRQCRMLEMPMGEWLRQKILGSPETITPDSFVGMRLMRVAENSENLDWVALLADTHPDDAWAHGYLDAPRVGHSLPLSDGDKKALGVPPTPWLPWSSAAEFERNPSARTLSTALKVLASAPRRHIESVEWRSSWPLAACLRSAQSENDINHYADLAERGIFGDLDDWKKAEQSWRNAANVRLPSKWEPEESSPFSLNSLKIHPPVSVMSWWSLTEFMPREEQLRTLQTLAVTFERCVNPRIREWIARASITLFRSLGTDPLAVLPAPITWLTIVPEMLGIFIPRIACMEPADLIALIEEISEDNRIVYPTQLEPAVELVLAGNTGPAFLRLVASSIAMARDERISDELQDRLRDVIRSLLQLESCGWELLTVAAYLGCLDEHRGQQLCQIVSTDDASDRVFVVLGAIEEGELSLVMKSKLFSEILKVTRDSYVRRAALIRLRNLFQRHKSELSIPLVWDKLGLALPRPREESDSRLALEGPVYIRQLDIRDICGIDSVSISPAVPTKSTGQWIVLLGPNGTGKTTILRSICLALRDTDDPTIWPRNSLSLPWIRVPLDKKRTIEEGTVSLLLDDGKHSTTVRGGAGRTFSRITPANHTLKIFAYGCRRGSALGGKRRQVDLSKNDGPDIATLFDDEADLIHAETWLLTLEGEANKSPWGRVVFEAVINALKRLLCLDSIDICDQRVWVQSPGKPQLPLDALSDGYLTNAGWVIDLIARNVEDARNKSLNIGPDFLSEIKGIVLIDEIDLHLHPRWQVDVISRTREIFPQLSFIVSSHNPLTIVGARAEEIWVLSDSPGGIIVEQGVEAPLLLTGGEIYQKYFGISDVYPSDLSRQIQRYSFLSRFALRDEEEQQELEVLSTTLSSQSLLPGWPVIEREINEP